MVVPLGSPQPVFSFPPLGDTPDVEEDKPVEGLPLVRHHLPQTRLVGLCDDS